MKAATPKNAYEILQGAFNRKQAKNPGFSRRSLAKQLGVSAVFASRVMAGKDPIPLTRLEDFAVALDMDLSLSNQFFKTAIVSALPTNHLQTVVKQVTQPPSQIDNYERAPAKKFSVLNQWYNIAILNLLTCDTDTSPASIAQRLNLKVDQVSASLDALYRAELIEEKDGQWRKRPEHDFFATSQTRAEVRDFHKQMLRKAYEELARTTPEAFEQRLITGFTMAVDPEHLNTAKKMIFDALSEISKTVSDGTCTDVYQLNVQFFPLTRKPGSK